MVWVVEGKLRQDGTPNPPTTSHYLRPSRRYIIASLPGSYPDPKNPKNNLIAKARMRDFTLNPAPQIPRKGAGELEAGDWTQESTLDNSDLASNLNPYSLTYKSDSKNGAQNVLRDGNTIQLLQFEPFPLKSGDIVKLPNKNEMIVTWVPIILCLASTLTEKQIDLYIQNARIAGIKLSFNIAQSHHTHFVPKSSSPTRQLCLAAMLQISVVSIKFVDNFLRKSQVAPRPIEVQQLVSEDLLQEGEEIILAKQYPEGGGDHRRWWGHSVLELDWTKRPQEEDFIIDGKDNTSLRELDWSKRVERLNMFVGILVISCRDNPEADRLDEELVKNGGGNFLKLQVSERSSPNSLATQVDNHKRTLGQPSNQRVVLLTSTGLNFEASDVEEMPAVNIVRQFAQLIGVRNYLNVLSLTRSIGAVDPAILFVEDELVPLPATNDGKEYSPSSALSSVESSSNIQTSSSILVGTHPEESSLGGIRDIYPRTSAQDIGSSASAGTIGDEEIAPPVVKKLTRRAKTKALPASSFSYEDLWGSAPQTQPSGPEYSLETDTTKDGMDIDSNIVESSQKPRKLKRRVGTTMTPIESQVEDLFDLQPTSKKSRQQVLENEEESERNDTLANIAIPSAVARNHTTRASSVVSENGETDKGKGKKRFLAEIISSGDEAAKSSKPKTSSKKPKLSVNESPPPPPPPPPVATVSSTFKKPAKSLSAKERAALAKVEKENSKDEMKSGVIQVPIKKGKTNAKENGFNEEFNKLKLVQVPSVVPNNRKAALKIAWDYVDGPEEELRLQREAEENSEHPEKWTQDTKQKSFFVIEYVDMARKNRIPARTDVELEEKYIGRPNFKRFRPKNSKSAPGPLVCHEVELVLSEVADFGLGEVYHGVGRPHFASQDENLGENMEGSNLKFRSKSTSAKPAIASTSKSKSKAKEVTTSGAGDDDQEFNFTETKKNGKNNQDEMDIDELDSDDSMAPTSNKSRTQVSKDKKAVSKSISKKPALLKKKTTTIVIDSDSDGDSGLTFKGFASTAKTTGGTKRKR